MSPLEAWLEEVEARTQAATEGEWFFNSYSAIFSKPLVREYDRLEDTIPDDAPDEAYSILPKCEVAWVPVSAGDTATAQGAKDATFIASARSDVPKLCAELRSALAREAALRGALGTAANEVETEGVRICDITNAVIARPLWTLATKLRAALEEAK